MHGSVAKQHFLNEYLATHSGIDPEVTAWIYAQLATLAILHESRGNYHKQAGFSWERVAMMHSYEGIRAHLHERGALKHAKTHYTLAARAFEAIGYTSLANQMRERAQDVRREIRQTHHPYSRLNLLVLTLLGFGMATLSWTQPFTGLVIAETSPEGSVFIGAFFFVLGLVGLGSILLRETV